MFNGALADLSLGSNPWTMGRYTFAGGNPTTLVEYDGHAAVRDIEGGGVPNPPAPILGPPSPEATALMEEALDGGIVLDDTLVLAPSGAELDSMLDAARADLGPGSAYGEWGCGSEPDPSSFRGALSTLAHPFRGPDGWGER